MRDLPGFFASLDGLLGAVPSSFRGIYSTGRTATVVPQLRGALLLHRFLETLRKHGMQASEALLRVLSRPSFHEAHLQLATSTTATNAAGKGFVCALCVRRSVVAWIPSVKAASTRLCWRPQVRFCLVRMSWPRWRRSVKDSLSSLEEG